MQEAVKISVICPMGEKAEGWRALLESVRSQTLKEIQILVAAEDPPAEPDLEFLRRLGGEDGRISLFAPEPPVRDARNAAMERAAGEYLSFPPSGGVLRPDTLERAYAAAREENADAVVWPYLGDGDELARYVKAEIPLCPERVPACGLKNLRSFPGNVFAAALRHAGDGLYKRSFVRERKLRFQDFRSGGELSFSLSAAVLADRVCFLEEALTLPQAGQAPDRRPGDGPDPFDLFRALAGLRDSFAGTPLEQDLKADYFRFAVASLDGALQAAPPRAGEEFFAFLQSEGLGRLGLDRTGEDVVSDPASSAVRDSMAHASLRDYLSGRACRSFLEKRLEALGAGDNMEELFRILDEIPLGSAEAVPAPTAPRVSVVIPVYNAREFLTECLDSVLGQTLRDIEVLCVDDGSTDGSGDIVRLRRFLDHRIRLLRQENQGAGPARNYALREARGEFISFMDADDYYPSPTVLERLYEGAVSHGAAIAGGSRLWVKENGVFPTQDQTFEREGLMAYRDLQKEYHYTCYLFSRRLLGDNGLFFPPYRRFQDPPFFVKAMVAAGTFYAIPDPVYAYRYRPAHVSWTAQAVSDLIQGVSDCMELAREHHLPRVYRRALQRIEYDFSAVIAGNLDETALRQLVHLEDSLDIPFANEESEDKLPEGYRLRVLRLFWQNRLDAKERIAQLEGQLDAVKGSRTWRIGKFFTRPYGSFKRVLRRKP